ncbi:MAG: FkbM family methyltransferase, partial [Verrucomicrobiae bacterium]|nr:FkbM family methyltransferase [Verrucomicrobiae bacterium]
GVVMRPEKARPGPEVPLTTIDKLVGELGLERVDFIKMDIEGCEGRALRGMLGLLRRHRPVILSEFGPQMLMAMSDITPEAYLQQLRSPGYDLFIVEKDSPGTFTRASDGEILARFKADGAMTHLDLLALPQDRRAD